MTNCAFNKDKQIVYAEYNARVFLILEIRLNVRFSVCKRRATYFTKLFEVLKQVNPLQHGHQTLILILSSLISSPLRKRGEGKSSGPIATPSVYPIRR
ncbi:hypothetical protein HMPREF1199_01319 [Hoylesella oralis CC98A]|nr:hypothetical protein HMPREF1199_01319 [Hoylesella oralis CC98A]